MSTTCKTLFPLVEGRDLIDHRIVLPHDVEDDLVLLIITYKRWHQDLIDTWTPYFKQLTDQFRRIQVYYLSMFNPKNELLRSIIAGYMRRFYPSKAEQASRLIIYTDLEAFNLSLDLPNTKSMYLLLINREGQVLWCGQNEFSQLQFDALCATIQASLLKA